MLVGINLLREGLDMPEVSLVAILDADKEGFLRSEKSLIQTIGRAARNVRGLAILYADKNTGSMDRAIQETNRRRTKQVAYNKKNKITPRTIRKNVQDIMENARSSVRKDRRSSKDRDEIYLKIGPDKLTQKIKELEKKMYRHARDLEFEEAAGIRDEIAHVRRMALSLPGPLLT